MVSREVTDSGGEGNIDKRGKGKDWKSRNHSTFPRIRKTRALDLDKSGAVGL